MMSMAFTLAYGPATPDISVSLMGNDD